MPVIKNNFRGWSTSIHSYLSTSGSLCGQHEEKRRVNNQVRHIYVVVVMIAGFARQTIDGA